ncbi:MAG: hypothetical protein P1U57_01605 [Oleibacter sp.]|nr:hypothetical protein [Thalassolituus sp.]
MTASSNLATEANINPQTSSRWHCLKENNSNDVHWCWLPGWSFTAEVFLPLIESLPGTHWGANYLTDTFLTDTQLTDNASPEAVAQQLFNQAPKPAIWIGWSLGGALAVLATQLSAQVVNKAMTESSDSALPSESPIKGLITLAAARTFISDDCSNEIGGMPKDTFAAFRQSLINTPSVTLKRFAGLCVQGHPRGRQILKELRKYQHPEDQQQALLHTLDWLQIIDLSQTMHTLPISDKNCVHMYGQQDALSPLPLLAAKTNNGNSHAFFLAEAGQQEVIEQLLSFTANASTNP